MIDAIIRQLFELKWFKNLKTNTVPRWIILLIDMLLVACSYVVFVSSNLDPQVTRTVSSIVRNFIIIVAVYGLVTYFSKSYTCVIRLSVIEDLYREFIVVFVSTVILILINLIYAAFTQDVLFSYWGVIFVGVLAFAMLTVERLIIKYMYARMTVTENKRRKVLVLGTSLDSLILANALKNEIGGKYEPVGLLSIKSGKDKDEINGFKVYKYNADDVANIFVGGGIHALIFDSSAIKLMRNGFADTFIENNIALLAINKVEEFELDDERDGSNISTYIKEVQIEDLLGREPIVLNNTLVRSHIKDSVVLITGACGSIGSEIVRQVATYKARRIILVDQAETPMHDLSLELQKDFPDADVVLFMGDVHNHARMEKAFREFQPKYVFHAAAYKHVPMMELNPTEAVLTNVEGTKNIADLALKYGVYKFVMVSTDKAVNPSNIMGCTKRLAEIYCQSLFYDAQKMGKNTQFITTRFGNVLGSNGSVIPLFRKQIENGGPVTVTHREIIRYFMTIPEACSLVLEAGCMGHGGEIYIFDMGQPVRIYDLATRMISLAGLRPNVDIKIEEIGLRPGEKLYEELLNDKENTIKTDNEKIMIAQVRKYDYFDVCNNIDNIIELAQSGNIHDMVKSMKQFVPEYKSMHSEYEDIDHELEEGNKGNDSYYFNPTAPVGE
ncbi:MAG: polysaccharide biosynthesis protein [Muribaculaceae bacterium]|nr:polysaccharide biosynthesis protein [Muribaculaceae bacterium]